MPHALGDLAYHCELCHLGHCSWQCWCVVPRNPPPSVGILFGVFTGSSAPEPELECRIQTPTSLLCELCLTWTVKLPYFWPTAVLIGLNKGIKVEDPAKSLTQGVIIPAMLPWTQLYPPHPLLGHLPPAPFAPAASKPISLWSLLCSKS